MKEFTTLEEAVKTMKKEELKHQLLIMNEVWNDFETFLEEKFGTGKVESLSKEIKSIMAEQIKSIMGERE